MDTRRTVFFLLTLVLVVFVVEGIAWVGLGLAEGRDPGLVNDVFVRRHFAEGRAHRMDEYRERWFDAELGWVLSQGTRYAGRAPDGTIWQINVAADGSRRGPGNKGELLVATYGDSFTAGDDVSDKETWQTVLSAKLGGAVKNYGVPGYGTYQALLRFERHLRDRPVAPVTVLGVFEDDIGRIGNGFRPLYLPATGFLLGFKPWLRLREGEVVAFEMPWKDRETPVQELEAMALRVARDDLWAERRVWRTPPHTLQVLRALAAPQRQDAVRELYDEPEGRALMRWVIERFLAAADEAGTVPVLLWIPMPGTMEAELEPGYGGLRRALAAEHSELLQVDVHELEFVRERFNSRPFRGHASAYGHQTIASGLTEVLHPVLHPTAAPDTRRRMRRAPGEVEPLSEP